MQKMLAEKSLYQTMKNRLMKKKYGRAQLQELSEKKQETFKIVEEEVKDSLPFRD
jgi:hypothetical protein